MAEAQEEDKVAEEAFDQIKPTLGKTKTTLRFSSQKTGAATQTRGESRHVSRFGADTKSNIVLQHMMSGVKFTDSAFPPEKTSLISNWEDYNNMKIYTWNKYTWKRVSEIYPQPIKVFNDIHPDDIIQGELGDCYFLSSLSALAEKPKRIEKLFETPEYEPSGCYKLRMKDMGDMREIIIDDFIPINTEGKVAFSRAKEEKDHSAGGSAQVAELWVMLLEKAWAKKFGSYWNIDAGFVNEVLTDLTGAPCKVMGTEDPTLWDELMEADQADYIIAASTNQDAGGADSTGLQGLVGQHAYAVISVAEVETAAGKERIMKIRNPWGDTEWNGDWCDTSPKWTEELKKRLDFTAGNDGTFWMPFEAFERFFFEVCICKVHDDYINQCIQVNQQPGFFSVTKITVAEKTHTYATVCQVDSRLITDRDDYEYSDVRIICTKILPDGSLEFDSSRGRTAVNHIMERDVFEGLRLDPGEYLIFVKLEFPEDPAVTKYGLSFYSSREMLIEDVTSQRQDFLDALFSLNNAKKHGKRSDPTPGCALYSWSITGDLSRENLFKAGYMCDLYHNETADKNFEVAAFHRRLENIVLLPPFEGESYKFPLAPGEFRAVIKEQSIIGSPFSAEIRPSVRTKK